MKILISMILCGVALVGQSVPPVNTPVTSWPLGAVPVWQKWTVANSGSNFLITRPDGTTTTVAKAGAVTQSVSLLTPAVTFKVTDCIIKSGTAFTGTTTLTATVGITGTLTGCVSVAYDMKAAVSVANFGLPTIATSAASFNGTDSVLLALTSTIDNLSSISAGSVTVWIRLEYLP